MKLRSIALAGAALAALSVSPALANDTQGWYLGLGVGYDHQEPIELTTAPPLSARFRPGMQDSGLVAGSFGYKWGSGLRMEFEAGYTAHDVSPTNTPSVPPLGGTLAGSSSLKSALVNFIYDWDLGGPWSISTGAGIGAGAYRVSLRDSLSPAFRVIRGEHMEFMWQGIVGVNYQWDPSVELFLDYRYRSAELDRDYASDFVVLSPIHIAQAQEHVAMFGVRWYVDESAPAYVAPPPPPPPPPPMPAPVKTFIVFFDFDKSNLTDKAQEVVAEAVRTAKANGFVKVLVTGHTDTVGSDSYNQALSVRRAMSVKDEMVREGLDGGGIEIVGKSFHDPLVPTGPGVREPQNRRAVIDLGG